MVRRQSNVKTSQLISSDLDDAPLTVARPGRVPPQFGVASDLLQRRDPRLFDMRWQVIVAQPTLVLRRRRPAT